MKKLIWIIIIIGAIGLVFWFSGREEYQEVSTFEECVDAGNPVMESYPRKCRDQSGAVFTENIGNELDKQDLIRVDQPRPNTVIASPVTIRGEARGSWFFEASFPVQIIDENGVVIAEHYATAGGDWMTTDFVPFEATVTFAKPASIRGELVLKKDNPSDLRELDDELRIPIAFSQTAEYQEPEPPQTECIVTGCSGQVCASEEMTTTCEYKEEYACYEQARCEVQESGECGWTFTDEFNQCVNLIE